MADKQSGALDLAMGCVLRKERPFRLALTPPRLLRSCVPLLYIDGVAAFGQSKAIERYLARQFGLMGANDVEAAKVDMVGEHVRDIKDKYAKAKAADGADKWFAEDLNQLLDKLSKVVAMTGTAGHAVGAKLSLADVQIFMLAVEHFDAKEKVEAAFKAQPKLQAVRACGAARVRVCRAGAAVDAARTRRSWTPWRITRRSRRGVPSARSRRSKLRRRG